MLLKVEQSLPLWSTLCENCGTFTVCLHFCTQHCTSVWYFSDSPLLSAHQCVMSTFEHIRLLRSQLLVQSALNLERKRQK